MISLLLPDRTATVQQLGHPSAGIIGWWDRNENTSGVAVNEDVALNFSAVWCATRVISETLASLPCIMYRRVNQRDRERAIDDPRFSLVHSAPNDEMSAYSFFETGTSHLVLWGNSYSTIVRRGDGQPEGMDLYTPDSVTVQRERQTGELEYRVSTGQGVETLEAPDVLHVAGLGFDGIMGYSVIRKAAQSIGSGIAAEQMAGTQFGNGATPSGVLSLPTKLDKDKREHLRREWNETHAGPRNSGKIAILSGGMTYQQIGMNMRDAQFLESRRFSVEDIARWFRIPPHLIGDLTRATFSNIEQQSLDFLTYSMLPWLRRWETNLNRRLLRRDERGRMFFEFLVEALLRADMKTRFEAHALARQWGFESVNEIRQRENLNSIGPEGDIYLQPLNMGPAGEFPAVITQEFREGLAASLSAIVETGREMRESMANLDGRVESVELAACLSITEANTRITDKLSSIRSDMNDMRSEVRQWCERAEGLHVQAAVRGDLPTANVSNLRKLIDELYCDKLELLLKIESTQAVKAANRQQHRGESFIAWLDEWYSLHEAKCAEAFGRVCDVAATIGIQIDVAVAVQKHIERSRSELLACADGDPDGFESRVKDCVSKWHERVAPNEYQ